MWRVESWQDWACILGIVFGLIFVYYNPGIIFSEWNDVMNYHKKGETFFERSNGDLCKWTRLEPGLARWDCVQDDGTQYITYRGWAADWRDTE